FLIWLTVFLKRLTLLRKGQKRYPDSGDCPRGEKTIGKKFRKTRKKWLRNLQECNSFPIFA
ncbi:MAG: hypothetical protein J5814_00545, partial [Bacteroidaceae bacterium]|nr:hypothetical protein [Bacteroidaceae bacterium]